MVKSQSVMWPCLSKLSLFVTRIEGVSVSTLWTIGPFARILYQGILATASTILEVKRFMEQQ